MTAYENTTRPFVTGGETTVRRFRTVKQAAHDMNVPERGIGVIGVEHFIEQAYARTASRIASGEIDFADMEQEEARTNGRN